MEQILKTDCKGFVFKASNPDIILGPSSDRYFSSGFKDTEHSVYYSRIEDGVLYADLRIGWPQTWAKKCGIQLKPHFGTLDFFLFSARLAEHYLNSIHQLSTDNMWITEFSFKAGQNCVEKESISASCKQLSSAFTGCHTFHLFEIKINNAIIHLKISLPGDTNENATSLQSTLQSTYYSTGYKEATRNIENIIVDTNLKQVKANYKLRHNEKTIFKGLGCNYMPCGTFCDLVLAGGQLSQILLFKMDNTTREQASNLWLRNIQSTNTKPIKGEIKIDATVIKSRIIRIKDLDYNCSDVIIRFNNEDLVAKCSFAYQPFMK